MIKRKIDVGIIPVLDPVMVPWITARYKMNGILYWAANFWNQTPGLTLLLIFRVLTAVMVMFLMVKDH